LGSNASIFIVSCNVHHGIPNSEKASALISGVNVNKLLQECPHDLVMMLGNWIALLQEHLQRCVYS
jgi:hypothetical protein